MSSGFPPPEPEPLPGSREVEAVNTWILVKDDIATNNDGPYSCLGILSETLDTPQNHVGNYVGLT